VHSDGEIRHDVVEPQPVEPLAKAFAGCGGTLALGNILVLGDGGVWFCGGGIARVDDQPLYLKADAQSAHLFKEQGLEPFSYPKGDKRVEMSYYQAPGEALEDPTEMKEWAQTAYEAALRSSRGRKTK
jgi:DNA transformation protein